MKLSILLIISLLFAAGCSTHQPVKPNEAKAAPKVESKADATAENNAFKNKIDGQICRRDKEVRSLWTEHMLPNGCKLWYSHYKNKGPAAWSIAGTKHCLAVSKRIVANLHSAGFKCEPN